MDCVCVGAEFVHENGLYEVMRVHTNSVEALCKYPLLRTTNKYFEKKSDVMEMIMKRLND